MAQDAEEPVTLDEVIRRVMRKEKQASATFAGTRASNNASKSAPPIPGTDMLLIPVFISLVYVHVTVIIQLPLLPPRCLSCQLRMRHMNRNAE